MNRLIIILILTFTLSNCSFKKKENKNTIVENKIEKVLSKTEIIEFVLKQLKIKKNNCKSEFISIKKTPNNDNESIVIIPELVSEDEYFFELNSHILIIDNKTGKIKNRFFESYTNNNWVSDALQIVEISIDTAPYIVKKGKRAFGIRVRHLGSSKPNPYETETISLFIKNENKLTRILKNFKISGNSGEWDTDCYGEFNTFEKKLIITDKLTNEYYNIISKSKIKNSKTFVNKQGECDEKNEIENIKSILKFENNGYKENKML